MLCKSDGIEIFAMDYYVPCLPRHVPAAVSAPSPSSTLSSVCHSRSSEPPLSSDAAHL